MTIHPLIGVHGRHVTTPSRVGTVIHVADGTQNAAMALYLLLDVPRDDGAVVDIVSSLDWTPTDPEGLRRRLSGGVGGDLLDARANLEAAKSAAEAARAAVDAAEATVLDAYTQVHTAEHARKVVTGREWLAAHPDDVETVRVGADWPRLKVLKLGGMDRMWGASRFFVWNDLGTAVRAALAAPETP